MDCDRLGITQNLGCALIVSELGLFAAVLVKLSSAIKDRVTVGDGAGSSLVVGLLLV